MSRLRQEQVIKWMRSRSNQYPVDSEWKRRRRAGGTFGREHGYLAALRNQRAMPDSYIIEVNSQTAGIVVRNPEGYRFFASSHRFNRLEGQLFRNAREAERAARRLVNGEMKDAA